MEVADLPRKLLEMWRGIDHYEVRYRPPNGRGWRRIEGSEFPRLYHRSEAPPDAETVRAIAEEHSESGWPSGHYRLYSVDAETNIVDGRWSFDWQNQEWEQQKRREKEKEELRKMIDRLRRDLEDGSLSPEEIDEVEDVLAVTAGGVLSGDLGEDQIDKLRLVSERWLEMERSYPW